MILSNDGRCIYCGNFLDNFGSPEVSRLSFLIDDVFMHVGVAAPICTLCKTKLDMQRTFLDLPENEKMIATVSGSG